MAGIGEIRSKEGRATLTVDGKRYGGTFSTIHDIDVKPDVQIDKKRFTSEQRARGDIDIKGYDFSFKVEKRDHTWRKLWKAIEEAERNSRPLPDIVLTLSYKYRDGSGVLSTVSLSGDLVLKMDSDSIPKDGYQSVSWSGFCSDSTDS